MKAKGIISKIKGKIFVGRVKYNVIYQKGETFIPLGICDDQIRIKRNGLFGYQSTIYLTALEFENYLEPQE